MIITDKMMNYENEEEKEEFFLLVKKCREENRIGACHIYGIVCPKAAKARIVFSLVTHLIYTKD